MNIFILILWIVIGAINIVNAANGGEISIVSYVCCWIVLLVSLAARCFDD